MDFGSAASPLPLFVVGTRVTVLSHPVYQSRVGTVSVVYDTSVRVELDEGEMCRVPKDALAPVSAGLPSDPSTAAVAAVVAPSSLQPGAAPAAVAFNVVPKRKMSDFSETDQLAFVEGARKVRVVKLSDPFHMQFGVLFSRIVSTLVSGPQIGAASVRFGVRMSGETQVEIADEHLQLVDSVDAGAVAAAAGAARQLGAAARFQVGSFVKFRSNVSEALDYPEAYAVVAIHANDGSFIISTPSGRTVVHESKLVAAAANPFNAAERPRVDLPIPVAPNGGVWGASQARTLSVLCKDHRNVHLTGPPGFGKSACGAGFLKSVVEAGLVVISVSVSNSIATEQTHKYVLAGVPGAVEFTGTLSSMLFVTLGKKFTYERLPSIVEYVLTANCCKEVRERIRAAHVILDEEVSTQLPHIQELVFGVDGLISRVCGYKGKELAANKQIVMVEDEAQLTAVLSEDGLAAGFENYQSPKIPYGDVDDPFRTELPPEPKRSYGFEACIYRSFFPSTTVVVASGAAAASSSAASAEQMGTVLCFCTARGSYVIEVASETSQGPTYHDPRTDKLVHAIFVEENKLRLPAGVSLQSVFVEAPINDGSYRVADSDPPYDPSCPASSQGRFAVYKAAVSDLHNGITGSPPVRELMARMLKVGALLNNPDELVWSNQNETLTRIYSWNRRLEKDLLPHLQRVRRPERYSSLDDSITPIFAVKCDESGAPEAPAKRFDWDGERMARQAVAGAHTCLNYLRLGTIYKLGTLPQYDYDERVPPIMVCFALRPALVPFSTVFLSALCLVLQAGKGQGKQRLKPGKAVVPIAVEMVSASQAFVHAGIAQEPNIIVECIEMPYDSAAGSYPIATIKWYDYYSPFPHGLKRWRALPLKPNNLATVHAVQSKGLPRILIFADFFWAFAQGFTSLTRATEPPPANPTRESLRALKGCIGIVELTMSPQSLFKPTGVALGLHPKVALRFHAQGKPVPDVVVRAARAWLAAHNANFLVHERSQLELQKSMRACGGQHVSLDDFSLT